MANDHRTIYSPLILLLVILLTSSSASNSKHVRVKRAPPPPKWEGIPGPTAVNITDNTGKPLEKVKVFRKFEKGTNSTINWVGDTTHLFCNLSRGNDTSLDGRVRVAWRLKENGEFLTSSDLRRVTGNPLPERYNYTETPSLTQIFITNVNDSDKGWYQCILFDEHVCRNEVKKECFISTFEIQLRVKDRMAKIYPSVSICAEVVLLFIVIVVYETRKSKTEIDESDTDGSPDQKNVSDTNGEGVSEATRLAKD